MLYDDAQQQHIIELSDTTALVLAGPGCGKTHILARRVFHASGSVDYGQMLCVTFTNRAAREMKQRIAGYLGYIPVDLFVGNMHRFCLRFLYDNGIIGSDTSVLDEEDQLDYLTTILDDVRPSAVTDFLTKAAYLYQKDNDHPEYIIRHPARLFTDKDHEAIDAYLKFKRQNRLIDFDDILLQTYTALQQRPAVDYTMTGYRWVQVDEVQDMTPLQLAIVEAVTRRHNRTLVYFGDEQQAIFRFLGAGGRALEVLKEQCLGNILRLRRNYRSPGYLVEMCNTLAADWLGIDQDFLPEAVDSTRDEGNMTLYSGDYEELAYTAANICRRRLAESPDENVAVLCRTNKDADYISELFDSLGLGHFHVSKQDLFHQLPFKTVWSHLAAVAQPFTVHPWARLLYQTRCCSTLTGARKLVSLLRNSGIGCDELLDFDKPLRVESLVEIYNSDREIVVFDTETTGLDVFTDDVVQIAAVKLRHGVITDRFEVFIQTDKRLPRELSPGVANPLVETYAKAVKISPDEAYHAFAQFMGDAIAAGHNLDFDTAIMRSDIARRTQCPIPRQLNRDAEKLDTLILSRHLYPGLKNHTLGGLLATLELEGRNSHDAADDTSATATLLGALANKAEEILQKARQARIAPKIKRCAEKFKSLYGWFYNEWRERLYDACSDTSLANAIKDTDKYMTSHGYTEGISRLDYVTKLIDNCIVDKAITPRFGQQVSRHLFDLLSFNEADLFTNDIVNERLSVMTIHKAKGLEMDNVVVFDASRYQGEVADHARVLYVAFSRARRRLAVGLSGLMPPPMRGLHHYFKRLTPNQVRLAVNCEYLNHRQP